MNVELWKIFSKTGSNLNLSGDAYLNLIINSDSGVNAAGYAITDPSTQIIKTYIKNSGWGYDSAIQSGIQLDYTFSEDALPIDVDVSIFYKDVSVFNPDPTPSKGISSIIIDDSTNYIYPSVTYAGALFLDPVSQGLIETEHLMFFQESSVGYVSPYDTSNGTLIFRMLGDEDVINFFTLDSDSQEITWAEELIFDVSSHGLINNGLQINIGFRSDEEGVYERRMVAYHRIDDEDFPLMELVINAQSIGRDERFDTLLDNFGLYKPESFSQLFKETDINEDLPDWKILNYKGKHMILEHNKILPFIGTYKALINAIKWLGYEDISVKEWFKNVKENTKLSLYVPYDADERKKTIKYFTPEERINLKKLNQLSLVYCINQETGEADEWGNPITENCYAYNLKEILIKLYALKEWLEKNIIGVNARIWDLTGEGIYFEIFKNFIYGTQNLGTNANYLESLTPDTIDENSELVKGKASVLLTLKEYQTQNIGDTQVSIIDMARYGWDPSNGFFTPSDYFKEDFYSDPSAVFIGSPMSYPFKDLYDIQWKLSLDKEYAGVLTTDFVTNPLFIWDNEIKFYNYFDTSSLFLDTSVNVDVTIEKGYLRDSSNDLWTSSLAYSIYPNFYMRLDSSTTKTLTYDASYAVINGSGIVYTEDTSIIFNTSKNPTYFSVDGSVFIIIDTSTTIESPLQNGYTLESSLGVLYDFSSQFSLQASTNATLRYDFNDNYKAPFLTIEGYKWTDSTGTSHLLERQYFLDIVDGKVAMQIDASMTSDGILVGDAIPNDASTRDYTNLTEYINFNYDTSLDEQKISLVVTYTSPRIPIFNFDPSDALILYYNPDASIVLVEDNSIYQMNVNHAGNYDIEVYGWNGQNNLFFNFDRDGYEIWQKYPIINSYIDTSCAGNIEYSCTSTYLTAMDISSLIDRYPIFDRIIPSQGLTLEYDNQGLPYINVPSISYFQDLPTAESITRYYNLTERIISINDPSIIVDEDFQSFYAGDDVKIVQFDKGKYSFIQESSASIVSGTSPTFEIDSSPSGFTLDGSSDWYILNNTERIITRGTNDLDLSTFTCDISNYMFEENQLVGILIEDTKIDYKWGSSFRVLDSSTIQDASWGYNHTLEGNVPEFVLTDPSYNLTAKHAFSTYSNFQIDIASSSEEDNNFKIYLDDSDDLYYHQYYLDNTFIFLSIDFDQERVLKQWYDPSTDAPLSPTYYPFNHSIKLDVSTLVILRAEYDPSNYMLDQKNIWTIREHDSDELIMEVFNDSLSYIFNEEGKYDVGVSSYDKFGNLKQQEFEGLIIVKDEE